MITKNIKLYLGDGFPVRIPVSQYDTMWQFVFTIIRNSQPWQIPTGATAVLNGRKPDGNVFAFAGTIENNTVTVDADVQMTAVAGQTVCELSILADGKTVGTANFILDVEEAPKSADDVVSDTVLDGYGMMVTNAVDDYIERHPEVFGGDKFTTSAKNALLALLEKVAYIDENGQTYIDALESELFPPASLVSISAVFTQGSAVIYDTDDLDVLRQYLVVTAYYDDSSSAVISNYALTGALTSGTSTITANYDGKTDTFNVSVTHATAQYVTDGLIARWDGIDNTGSGHSSSATTWKDLVGSYDITIGSTSTCTWADDGLVFPGTTVGNVGSSTIWATSDAQQATIEIVTLPNYSSVFQIVAGFDVYSSGTSSRQFQFDQYGHILFRGDSSAGPFAPNGTINDVKTISAVYDNGASVAAGYMNGQALTLTSETKDYNTRRTDTMKIRLGRGYSNENMKYNGKILAIRVYNRRLTAAEIAQNYAADVDRFFGA